VSEDFDMALRLQVGLCSSWETRRILTIAHSSRDTICDGRLILKALSRKVSR
jgi:hypothetical protein